MQINFITDKIDKLKKRARQEKKKRNEETKNLFLMASKIKLYSFYFINIVTELHAQSELMTESKISFNFYFIIII